MMGDRVAKDALYAEFAAVGKSLGNPKRLELLDLLAHDAVRLLNANGLTARRAADGVLEWRIAGIPVVQPGAA
jgi:hypothetical protein